MVIPLDMAVPSGQCLGKKAQRASENNNVIKLIGFPRFLPSRTTSYAPEVNDKPDLWYGDTLSELGCSIYAGGIDSDIEPYARTAEQSPNVAICVHGRTDSGFWEKLRQQSGYRKIVYYPTDNFSFVISRVWSSNITQTQQRTGKERKELHIRYLSVTKTLKCREYCVVSNFEQFS
ncbi:hypothetical protein CPB84DRAFT_1746532 [Gymnopilus junonius]|uniref:Uncharacterized protein n=1 Tax=Gymnopilus junonius TaxID=109634 RepID=A0A9P5NQE2_GYMJU|nr:hypothetical protein CPB84DRAFT_1746532 [Gymnopilus junonius]